MGLFAFGRIASKENHAFDVSSMALEQARTCAIAKGLNNSQACGKWARVQHLQIGSIVFIGCKNTSAGDFKDGKGIRSLKAPVSDDEYKRKGPARILRAFTSISKDLKQKYAVGGVAVAKLKKPLTIYAFTSGECSISRENEQEYDTDEAQCFCKDALNGFARWENEQLVDIRVCDADDPSVVQLIGFIPKDRLGSNESDNDIQTDVELLTEMDKIGLPSMKVVVNAYAQQRKLVFQASRVKRKAPKRKPTKTKRKASNTCYCLRCKRAVVPLAPRMTVTANGRNLMKGTCPNCSGRVASFRA